MSTTSEIVQTLIEFGVEPDKARFAAARYSDAERAINWCFDAGSDWTPSQDDAPPPPALPPVGDGTAEQPIDMTLAGADMDNDDELRKAIAVSLSENGDGTGPSPTGRATPANGHPGGGTVTFGPSMQEGTDQNALVSTSTSGWDLSPPALSTSEEKQMNEAMFASFHESLPGSDTIFLPRTPGPRQPGAPLALYNPDPGMAFAIALVQGLLALSSFREVLGYSYPDPIPSPPPESDLSWLSSCLPPQAWDELQDLARQISRTTTLSETASVAEDPEAILVGIDSGSLWPRVRRNAEPFDPASSFYEQIDELTGKGVAAALIPQEGPPPPLFQSLRRTARSSLRFFNFKTVQPLAPLGPTEEQAKLSIYSVSSLTNSLHKAISGQLWPSSGSGDDQRRWAIDGSGPHALAIFLSWPKTVSFGSRVPFELEEKVFVDRYLQRNFQQVFRLQASEGVLRLEEEEIAARRSKLTTVKGKDVRSHLVNALTYYETLAKPSGIVDIDARTQDNLAKLKVVLQEFDAEVARLGERLADVQVKRQGLFDGADLQKCPLELKAVLMHNGLHTAGSIYAYVRHEAKWWRVADGTSTEVTFDAVQADQSGLFLGAGPFCLLYERSEEWVESEEEDEDAEGGGLLAPAPVLAAEELQRMDEDIPTGLTTPPPDDVDIPDDAGLDVDRMLGVEQADRSPE